MTERVVSYAGQASHASPRAPSDGSPPPPPWAEGQREELYFLLDPGGALLGSSLPSGTEPAASLCETARRWVRAATEAALPRSASLPEGVRLIPLETTQGRRYLVHLTVAPAPGDALRRLTPAQRAVASLAVIGATVPEMARALGRHPETVRTHLRQIYQRLDVGSRLELARALTDLPTEQPCPRCAPQARQPPPG